MPGGFGGMPGGGMPGGGMPRGGMPGGMGGMPGGMRGDMDDDVEEEFNSPGVEEVD